MEELEQRVASLEFSLRDQKDVITGLLEMLINADVIERVQYDVKKLN